jgi:hypothetical protein
MFGHNGADRRFAPVSPSRHVKPYTSVHEEKSKAHAAINFQKKQTCNRYFDTEREAFSFGKRKMHWECVRGEKCCTIECFVH